MSLRQARFSGSLIGRSAKTIAGPLVGGLRNLTTTQLLLGFTSASSGASVNTVGSFVQATASTAADSGLLMVWNQSAINATDNGFMMDIALGAAGAETIIVQNLALGGTGYFTNGFGFPIPVRIPAGSRLSYRMRAGTASRSASPVFVLQSLPLQHMLPASVDVIGSSTATSHGTALGGASGTYTQMTASTSQSYQAMLIVPSTAGAAGSNANFQLTLAIGPAGSEVDIGSLNAIQATNGTIGPNTQGPQHPALLTGHIPTGSRLSIKHNIAANPQHVEVCLVGVPL